MTSLTFDRIKQLAEEKKLRFSLHAFERLAEENITAREVVDGVSVGTVVEDYPDYHVGPCVLVLQSDYGGLPIHVVWGIPKLDPDEAVVVTSYRPDPDRWSPDFLHRIEQ